jgi:hypothetical protein
MEMLTCAIFIDFVRIHYSLLFSHFKPLKMDLTEGSETSANIKQTLGKHPKVNTVKNTFVYPPVCKDLHVIFSFTCLHHV